MTIERLPEKKTGHPLSMLGNLVYAYIKETHKVGGAVNVMH